MALNVGDLLGHYDIVDGLGVWLVVGTLLGALPPKSQFWQTPKVGSD